MKKSINAVLTAFAVLLLGAFMMPQSSFAESQRLPDGVKINVAEREVGKYAVFCVPTVQVPRIQVYDHVYKDALFELTGSQLVKDSRGTCAKLTYGQAMNFEFVDPNHNNRTVWFRMSYPKDNYGVNPAIPDEAVVLPNMNTMRPGDGAELTVPDLMPKELMQALRLQQ